MREMLLVWRGVPQVELLGKVATDGDGQGCAFHLLNVTFEGCKFQGRGLRLGGLVLDDSRLLVQECDVFDVGDLEV